MADENIIAKQWAAVERIRERLEHEKIPRSLRSSEEEAADVAALEAELVRAEADLEAML